MKKRVVGFTLIELEVVIVILSILAVVALLKYLSLNQSAQTSVMESVAGSFRYVVDNVRINAVLQGVEKQRGVAV